MKSNEILQPNYCMYMYYKIMTSCSSLHSDSIEKLQRRLKVECQRSSATVIELQNMCPKVIARITKAAADLEISIFSPGPGVTMDGRSPPAPSLL